MTIRNSMMACLVAASLAGPLLAQLPKVENVARQQLVREFERNAPRVGDQLPSIELFDATGKKVNFDSLRGHMTVLVFGCLT